MVASHGDVATLSDLSDDVKAACDARVQECVGKIGENIKLLDVYINTAPHAYVYSHPGDKIVAIVYYTPISEQAETLAKQTALQIAAMNPDYLSKESIPADIKQAAIDAATAEMAGSNKPADMIEKIVTGKVDKAFSENVLMEQSAIWDDSKKVKDCIANHATITSFVRMTVGA
jgi:elongation factor Ts